MANVAIRIKYIVLIFLIISTLIVTGKIIYKNQYLNSYKEIGLSKIAQCSDMSLTVDSPYWVSVTSLRAIKNIETKYGVALSNIDFQKKMIIISYGAELKSLDYNLRESTFKTRGYYIGFPKFGNLEPNTIFIYKADLVQIFNTDVAGFSPDYNGKYR